MYLHVFRICSQDKDHVYYNVWGVAFYTFVCCCLCAVAHKKGGQCLYNVYYDRGVKYAYVFEIC